MKIMLLWKDKKNVFFVQVETSQKEMELEVRLITQIVVNLKVELMIRIQDNTSVLQPHIQYKTL